MKKEVKIIGLSVKENFGMLKATELTFNQDMHLTTVKGEVGAGKTTLNKAMRLTTQGGATLEDNKLYGDTVDLEAQLTDGEHNIFIGCKSDASGKLIYTLYEYDENGKKVNNPVIDGVKATPAAYLKHLSTALTWRLPELTSENPVTQRNILLELYEPELAKQGVIFDKKNPNYVGGIIDQIEKAKNNRNNLDSKRKEVGGIQSDLINKGIDVDSYKELKDIDVIKEQITTLKVKIESKSTNVKTERESELNALKLQGMELANELKSINVTIESRNNFLKSEYLSKRKEAEEKTNEVSSALEVLNKYFPKELLSEINKYCSNHTFFESEPNYERTLEFNEKGSIISLPDFEDEAINELIKKYRQVGIDYSNLANKPIDEVDTTKETEQLEQAQRELISAESYNKEAKAVNAFKDWQNADQQVKDLQKDYYLKLTEIETGVSGLKIVPEDNDIFLMYNGEYDPEYFHNQNKELRKLSAYSDTQKPMICLLIQNYLLSKKTKRLPYLWIDQVPIDKKTKALLDKMSNELGLYLFVNWTGDFSSDELQEGEILIENGEVFFKN